MNAMDKIKIAKVENVRMRDRYSNNHTTGTLYLTATHLIFMDSSGKKEILNTHVASVHKLPLTTMGSLLHINCKHFLAVAFVISNLHDSQNLFESLVKLLHPATTDALYCFSFRGTKHSVSQATGWNFFDIQSEFQRQGVPNKEWNLTYLNTNYEVCDTYPRYLYVPATCANNILVGSAKFRSKGRLPVLTYLHSNKAAICRCSQPLSGFNARCPEDEQMLYHILCTNTNCKYMYVVDTRPRINAMANRAAGKGYENENFYDNIKFRFFGIENIHVMRLSLDRLMELRSSKTMSDFLSGLESCGWLKHIRSILETAWFIVRAIMNGTSVVVHCSDGWDRTAQVCSIAALLLDPFYRTIQGFQALIEKDWLSFGHKFSDRCGYIGRDGKEVAPIFTQFIDATYQLLQQYPYMFEFNEKFLVTLHYHVHSCRYGTFVGNCEKDRQILRVSEKTFSLWGYIGDHINEYINPLYSCNRYKDDSNKILEPKLSPQSIVLWRGLYFKYDSGIHPRETWEDFLLTSYDHTSSLEDHVKWLLKRIDSLKAHLIQIVLKDSAKEDMRKHNMLMSQLESELKSVALEWKSFSKVEECVCLRTFDVFTKKNHCWSCGNVYCRRCMNIRAPLAGHLSQRAVPICKSCSQTSPVSS